ncbi:hypothetical protein JIG36_20255 [Actinoplanes sp. LDG1-06]|uniref:Uncharacterized protein n=1 Tax=Paractinoplanes ovalisporus TaxID=2810368 RepID=A0ABS2ADI0_9ACTN|nr:hypothetical protein [Actinoplanes ovalisporus]MBM2617893.1 hypothetical protein [Actinoplanes ovalisporus]
MLDYLDPTVLGIALVIWPATRSLIVMGAAAITVYSRDERRRRAAERVLRALGGSGEPGES